MKSLTKKSLFRTPIFNWGMVLVWMTVIFWLSHQPKIVYETFQPSNVLDQPPPFQIFGLDWDTFVGKAAHVLLFGVLAWLIKRASGDGWQALALTLSYACLDELHQLFVEGRGSNVVDIVIDGVAACLVLTVIWVVQTRLNPPVGANLDRLDEPTGG